MYTGSEGHTRHIICGFATVRHDEWALLSVMKGMISSARVYVRTGDLVFIYTARCWNDQATALRRF